MILDSVVTISFRTITEMSELYGVSHRTLRFYESIGLLAPSRTRNVREYYPQDETRLKIVISGRRLGLALRDIKILIDVHKNTLDVEPVSMQEMMGVDAIAKQIAILEEQRAAIRTSIEELRLALKLAQACTDTTPE